MSNAGRVVLVTGAASGIGRATAERLAEDGASVVAADSNADGLGWTEAVPGVRACPADVTSESDNAEMVRVAVEELGGLHALVLNAGVATPGGLEGLPLESLDHCLDVNLRGVVLGLRAALPALRRADAPAAAVTASVSGLAGDPNMWAYNAAKGAVVNLVRSAAVELGRDGIRVNGICPGPTRTGMTTPIEQGAPEVYETLRRNIPLGRWGEAREIAEVICFMVSPEASFVTGVLLPVDGGVMANTGQFDLGA